MLWDEISKLFSFYVRRCNLYAYRVIGLSCRMVVLLLLPRGSSFLTFLSVAFICLFLTLALKGEREIRAFDYKVFAINFTSYF